MGNADVSTGLDVENAGIIDLLVPSSCLLREMHIGTLGRRCIIGVCSIKLRKLTIVPKSLKRTKTPWVRIRSVSLSSLSVVAMQA